MAEFRKDLFHYVYKNVVKPPMRKEQLESICTDLQNGKARKLLEVLATLGKCISNCKERTDEF